MRTIEIQGVIIETNMPITIRDGVVAVGQDPDGLMAGYLHGQARLGMLNWASQEDYYRWAAQNSLQQDPRFAGGLSSLSNWSGGFPDGPWRLGYNPDMQNSLAQPYPQKAVESITTDSTDYLRPLVPVSDTAAIESLCYDPAALIAKVSESLKRGDK